MRNIIALIVCFSLVFGASAQVERNCSTMDNLSYRLKQNPELKQRMQDIEVFTSNRIQQMRTARQSAGGVITIPVVVHVIYNREKSRENISTEQILSQIDVLNEDYRRLNADRDSRWPQAADTKIEFCMARVDPYGNPTNGITRTASSREKWGTNDEMKKASKGGVNPWNTKEYLNMWVCNIGNGYLGYAQFPGGSAATDGVVMSPQFFGSSEKGNGFYLQAPYHLGRTATHEVGHYLNLRHIWGDGACSADDFVADTPKSDSANYGCATAQVSCGSQDMVQNYMDYSDDACMNLFTQGQKERMLSVLSPGGFRYGLALSNKCEALGPPTCSDGVQNGDETGIDCGGSKCEPCRIACDENRVKINITFDEFPEEVSWTIKTLSGESIIYGAYTTGNADFSTVEKEICLPDGCYEFTIKDVFGDGICCDKGRGSYKVTFGDKVLASGGDYKKEETTTFCIGDVENTCEDGIQNGDETGVDCGGYCKPCEVDNSIINQGSFETSWNDWEDGGSDCFRYKGPRAFEGEYAIRLRDDSGEASAMTSKTYEIKNFKSVAVEFYFYAYSMEQQEQLLLRFYNGTSWQTIGNWANAIDFQNNTFYKVNVAIDATEYKFTNNAKFRFESKATSNSDMVYIDKVTIKGDVDGLQGAKSSLEAIRSLNEKERPEIDFTVYPNPTQGSILNVRMVEGIKGTYRIVNMMGQLVKQNYIEGEINVNNLPNGVYFIEFNDGDETIIKKFIKS